VIVGQTVEITGVLVRVNVVHEVVSVVILLVNAVEVVVRDVVVLVMDLHLGFVIIVVLNVFNRVVVDLATTPLHHLRMIV
jgi:hypothetical protein